jgi:hypothetical protein
MTSILLIAPVDTFDPTLDSPLNAARRTILFQPALDTGLHPDPPSLVFPALFLKRKDGVLVCPWSTSVA